MILLNATWRILSRAIPITLISLLALLAPLAAQEAKPLSLKIIQVDTANFPEISVTVWGENLPPEAGQSITLLEDGVEQPLNQNNRPFERVGNQIALILDASSSILQRGATGDPRFVEAGYAVQKLVEGKFLAETDWLTSIVPVAGGESQLLQAWTQDHGAVSNSFFNFKPDKNIGETSLSSLISYALNNFPAAGQPETQTSPLRAVVIFSDGIVKGDTNLDAALQQAKQANIAIHTVLVGPETIDGRAGMQRIATDTGGQYIHLAALKAMDDFWQAIVPTHSQGVLTYRSHKADPHQLKVQLRLENGQALEQTEPIPLINPPIQPVELQLQLTPPLEGDTLKRSTDKPEAALSELEPRELVIEVQVLWLDSHPRQLKSLTVNFGDKTETLPAPGPGEIPLARFPIADLGEGTYTLRVSAVDELGLASKTVERTFSIVEDRPLPTPTPLPPTPTLLPTSIPTPQPGSFFEQSGLAVAIVAFGLIGLVALLVAIYTLRTVRQRLPEPRSGATESKTEPFVIDRSQKFLQPNPRARLILIDGNNSHLPQVIELYSGNTLIGRDPTLVNVVLKERRVSRYHCRVSEEADGTFRIWDEGSTSGTFINFEQLGMSGQILKQGDLINLGPVQYRFEPEDGMERFNQPEEKSSFRQARPPTDSTEPSGGRSFGFDSTEPDEPDMGQATEPEDPSWKGS